MDDIYYMDNGQCIYTSTLIPRVWSKAEASYFQVGSWSFVEGRAGKGLPHMSCAVCILLHLEEAAWHILSSQGAFEHIIFTSCSGVPSLEDRGAKNHIHSLDGSF